MTMDTRYKLLHAVTEYDRKQQSKPGYNIYALSHYLGAVDDAMKLIDGGNSIRAALVSKFCGRLLDVVLKSVGEPKSTDSEQAISKLF